MNVIDKDGQILAFYGDIGLSGYIEDDYSIGPLNFTGAYHQRREQHIHSHLRGCCAGLCSHHDQRSVTGCVLEHKVQRQRMLWCDFRSGVGGGLWLQGVQGEICDCVAKGGW